jgi:hypothetical protein
MCTLNPPCVIRPSSHWPELEWDGPAVGKKAASRPSEHRIWVERTFWDSIAKLAATPSLAAKQRLALVCHEKGHDEGAECEECADTRGGQIYRELGLDNDDAAVEMFLTRLQNRSADGAAQAFHSGFKGVHGERPADAATCQGSVDGAGLCKAAPVMSFYGAEGVETRRLKARARGMDEGQCRCIHAGAGLPVPALGADLQLCPTCCLYTNGTCDCSISASTCGGFVVGGWVGPFGRGRGGGGRGGARHADAAVAKIFGLAPGADAVTSQSISAELQQIPFFQQTFNTSNVQGGSGSDSLANIIADAAMAYFPDDPRRYAWLLAATVYLEAPRSTAYAGILNAAGDNRKKDPSRPGYLIPLNANGSIDYGLMQINDRAHASLLAQTLSDGTPAWENARVNMGMGASVLAQARQAYPGNIAAALLDYQGGPQFVSGHLASDPSLYLRANLPPIPTTSAGWQALAAQDALLYKLVRLASWGAPDPMDPNMGDDSTDDSVFSAAHASAVSAISDLSPDATTVTADPTSTDPSAPSIPSPSAPAWSATSGSSAQRPAWVVPLAIGLAIFVLGYLIVESQKADESAALVAA